MPGAIPGQSTHLVVLGTVGGDDEARALIKGLVDERVVARGTMVGARSIFRWEGAVNQESETLVLLKTSRERWHDPEAAVKCRHPNDVPEQLALPVVAGPDAYLNWVNRETSTAEASEG